MKIYSKHIIIWIMIIGCFCSIIFCSKNSTTGPDVQKDTQPPSISITYPENNSTVSGTINITATATDNRAVAKVEFYIDGQLRYTDTSSPWKYAWNCGAYSGGSQHTLKAKAYDAAGNSRSSSSISVTISGQSAVSYSVDGVWWTEEVDNDNDGCKSYGKLNFDVDVSYGSRTIYVELYYATAASVKLYATTTNFTVSGLSDDDAQSIEVGYPVYELYNYDYDFELRVYESGSTSPEICYGPWFDHDLSDICFEYNTQDGPEGGAWSSLGSGLDSYGYTVSVYNSQLIAGGVFHIAGDIYADYIAAWDGSAWMPLGSGMNSLVFDLAIYNGKLIAAGDFYTAGSVSANRIAAWNGSSWSKLGSGMNYNIEALTVYNGRLIAGGNFTSAGGIPARSIAAWDGSSWSPLGSGIDYDGVYALTVYNGQLIAGGDFSTAGGVSANNIAAWNGSYWSSLGTGINHDVEVLTVFNGQLIAGGHFTTASGISANRIAAWNGSSWSSLGTGMNQDVEALTVFNGQLIAGGRFTTAGGISANRIAAWNGSSWSSLGLGMNGNILDLTVYNSLLITTGGFTTAGEVSASRIAAWSD